MCRTRNSYAGSNCSMWTNSNVMGHHNLVIQFDTIIDLSSVQCPPIDSCISTDLNIIANHNPAKLSNFSPLTLVLWMRCTTKPICTQYSATENNTRSEERRVGR